MKNKNVVFFDFDKTIVIFDSFFYFLKYISKNKIYFYMIKNSHLLFISLFSKKWRMEFKNILWKYLYLENTQIEILLYEYFEKNLNYILNKNSIETLKLFDKNNFDIYIVSASSNYLIKSFTEVFNNIYNINLIPCGSESYFDENNKTYQISKNFYGLEKSIIINKILHEKEYNYSFAYGDSKGDKHMLKWCDKGYVGKDVMKVSLKNIKNY